MDRHKDWAVIVCLVGGGQEINTGEAGIDAWLDAVNRRFPEWEMFISLRLTDSEYAAGRVREIVRERPRAHFDDSLHLAVSMRSFRAENVSAFVKALLDCDKAEAKTAHAELATRYPIAITRDLNAAKQWIRDHARGTERYGLVASSKAMRLKPHAIDIRASVNPVHYFLNDGDDIRSSFYLEDAATEFQVQGLELDWACVAWCGDFLFNGSRWDYHDFRGPSAGAKSQTLIIEFISAMPIAFCSRARGKAWSYSFRRVTAPTLRARQRFMILRLSICKSLEFLKSNELPFHCSAQNVIWKMELLGSAT